MASRITSILSTKGEHNVGNLNSLKIKTVANGAIVADADIDNFTLVELGVNIDGERTCTQLSAVTNKGYLIASPEQRMLGNFIREEMVDIYNEVGERARIVILESGYTRFDTSAYSLNRGVTEAVNGLVAHFDPTTKKFILSTVGAEHEDYATAVNTFEVVAVNADTEYTLGLATVRLEAK